MCILALLYRVLDCINSNALKKSMLQKACLYSDYSLKTSVILLSVKEISESLLR